MTAFDAELAAAIVDRHRHIDGGALSALLAIQHEFGFVPVECIDQVAAAFNLSRAEVHGVVSFYRDFRREPPGRVTVKLCRAEACQAAGGDAIAASARGALGIDWHGTTSDQRVTLEPVFCLGLCSVAPAAMVGSHLLGRLTGETLTSAIDEAAR